MTIDERREQLAQIRSLHGGSQRIAAIYNSGQKDDDELLTPASFVQAMIDCIVRREFPNGSSDRRRIEVGDLVRTADGVAAAVATIDEAYCTAYVRLHDDLPGVGLQLVKVGSLERSDAAPESQT